MERGRIQGLPIFLGTPIISGNGKATDFKFGGYIYRAYPNKSTLKILKKRERGRIQGLPNFWVPLLSQERVKLRNSNFVGTFIGSIGTKAYENVGNSGRVRSQRVPKIFRAHICRAHCAVIFAIAQLSCLVFFYCAPALPAIIHVVTTGASVRPSIRLSHSSIVLVRRSVHGA